MFAVLLFPLIYLSSGFVSALFIGGREHSMAGAAVGDAGVMLLPSVVIYLISLLFVRRLLRELSTLELAAGSLLVTVFAPVLVAVSVMLIYAGGNARVADYAFFFVAPFVPPMVACWLALRIVRWWHVRRAGHLDVPIP